MGRSTVAKVAALAGAAGAAVLAGAAPATAATAMTVTPSSGLADGQLVHAQFQVSAPTGTTAPVRDLFECPTTTPVPDPDACLDLGPLTAVKSGPAGAQVWTYSKDASVKKVVHQTTCSNQCFLYVFASGTVVPALKTPISFKAPK